MLWNCWTRYGQSISRFDDRQLQIARADVDERKLICSYCESGWSMTCR